MLYFTLKVPTRRAGAGYVPTIFPGWLAFLILFAIAGSSNLTLAQTHDAHKSSFTSEHPTSEQIVLGDVIPVGDGTARTWVRLDEHGRPSAAGITLTEAALEGLPTELTPGLIFTEFLLDFPDDIPQLPFDHMGLNWNPRGHMPNGIYNVPHFDFHFYMIGPEQRSQITARGEDLERCSRPPAAGSIPEGYIFAPDSEEPGMGGHWVDPQSHEFHGQAFTSTFLYGTYDGEIIFWEPMITKAYLETNPDVEIPLKLPQAYAQEAYYPTSYSIRYDAERKEYTVAIEGLTLRQQSAAE